MSLFSIGVGAAAILIMVGGVRGRYYAGELTYGLFGGLVFVAFFWQYATFMQSFSDAFVHGMAPTPQQLTNSYGSTFKTASGSLGGVAALMIGGWSEAITLAIIYGLRQVVLFVAPFFLPLIGVMTFLGPHKYIRKFGQVLWWQYHGLVFMTWPAAIVLGFAYDMKWSFTTNGAENFVCAIGLVLFIICVPLFIEGSCLLIPLFYRKQAGKAGQIVGSRLPGKQNAKGWYRSHRGSGDESTDEIEDGKKTAAKSENNVDIPAGTAVADGGTQQNLHTEWADAHGAYSQLSAGSRSVNVRRDSQIRDKILQEKIEQQRDLTHRVLP